MGQFEFVRMHSGDVNLLKVLKGVWMRKFCLQVMCFRPVIIVLYKRFDRRDERDGIIFVQTKFSEPASEGAPSLKLTGWFRISASQNVIQLTLHNQFHL